ncbi:MAG: ABC transporter ATP-binding protein [Bacteroidales bacterium]|nr:ABC transporter ATP-binding protein [Bacteroidales bacterium]
MIEFKNISFKYDQKLIFDNFSTEIKNGQKVAIIGESGSGKSTFLNLLAGFEIPNSGEIFVDDIKLSAQNMFSVRQKIAWLPQNFNVPFDTTKELFFSPFSLKNNKKNRPTQPEIDKVFLELGIAKELLEKKIDEVSGGQKQRIMLASIILTKKKYIFLDEPTSALDDHSTSNLLEILLNLTNTTVIAATHDKIYIDKADKIINLTTH